MPTTAPPDLPDLLTLAEAADLVRVDERTLRRWIASGDLPTVRPGQRRVFVTRQALAVFIDASTRPATRGPLAGRTA